MTLEPGTPLGPYEIVGSAGAGGMGEVYRARDTRLGRAVAIKVLPPHLQEDAQYRRRFEREARTISQLQHPHVCALYDIGDEDGTAYLVMEYLEGKTLEERLDQGPLPIEEVLEIGRQVAAAVGAAHAGELIHRDLKPSNVMLTTNGAKVLDFGLARHSSTGSVDVRTQLRTATAPMTQLTREGSVLGTLPYMAPEQLEQRAPDARTDVWALGCLLYEMTTGERPFRGDSDASLIASIMSSEPEPPSRRVALAPAELEAVTRRCLEKDPSRRWANGQEVARALEGLLRPLGSGVDTPAAVTNPSRLSSRWRWVAAGAVVVATLLGWGGIATWRSLGPPRAAETEATEAQPAISTSVAVLPFENLGEESFGYLVDGLGESLLRSLQDVEGLRVAAQTSSSRFRGTDLEPHQIGRQLGVAYLVQGNIRRVEETIHVELSMAQTQTNERAWATRFEHPMAGVLDLEDRISTSVSEALESSISTPETRQALADRLGRTQRGTDDLLAYQAYLKGREQQRRNTRETLAEAIVEYEKALEIDPTYARAWAALARCQLRQAVWGVTRRAEGMLNARGSANRAIGYDPRSATPYLVLSEIQSRYEWNFEKAERSMRTATELAPGHADVTAAYGVLLSQMGRVDEAVQFLERSWQQDPLNAAVASTLTIRYTRAGRFEDAQRAFEALLEMRPEDGDRHWLRAQIDFGRGEYQSAYDAIQADELDYLRLSISAIALHHLGRDDESRAHLQELIETDAEGAAFQIAEVYAQRSEVDEAFRWLERAHDQRDPGFAELLSSPFLVPLYGEQRFEELAGRLGLGTRRAP